MAGNEMHSSSILNDEELERTIKVRGLPAWVNIDALQNFFENDSIGGPVDEVTIYWLSREAEIIFEQVEGENPTKNADKVASKGMFGYYGIDVTAERVCKLPQDGGSDHTTDDKKENSEDSIAVNPCVESERPVFIEKLITIPFASALSDDHVGNQAEEVFSNESWWNSLELGQTTETIDKPCRDEVFDNEDSADEEDENEDSVGPREIASLIFDENIFFRPNSNTVQADASGFDASSPRAENAKFEDANLQMNTGANVSLASEAAEQPLTSEGRKEDKIAPAIPEGVIDVPSSNMELPDTNANLTSLDLQCGCSKPSKMYTKYLFDDVHLGFICPSCFKEWLLVDLVPHSDEPPVCHDDKVYFSPKIKNLNPEELESDTAQCQATTSRKNIIPQTASNELKRGDHIMWHRPYVIWHHAIVESVKGNKITLIHFDSISKLKASVVMSKDLDITKECGTLYQVVYSDEVCRLNPVELVLARAQALIGISDYQVLNKNCENFATFCKTGNNTNQQKKWFFRQLKETLKGISSITIADAVKNSVKVVCTDGIGIAEEGIELATSATGGIGAGVVVAFEGIVCICNLQKLFKKRKKVKVDGTKSLSREDFIKEVVEELSIRVFGTAFFLVAGLPALFIPGIGPVAGCVLSVIGGNVGLVVGKTVGKCLGPFIARSITRAIKTNDQPVTLEELQPGDHVVFYGSLLHPRCHAIVSEVNKENGTLIVIRSSYKHRSVIYHKLFFRTDEPILKVFYPQKIATYSAYEIIKRAEEAAGDSKKYNILLNNCKDFVYGITLKR